MRKVSAGLAALIISIFFSGCNAGYTIVDNGAGMEDNNVTAPGELPVVRESITLSCAIEWSSTVQDYETNDYTLWLEEQTGIKLSFEVMRDMRESLRLKIAAGSEIPEVVMGVGFDELAMLKNGVNGSGILLDLGSYMDNYGYWMNDIYTKSTVPDIDKQLYSLDGGRYFMPSIVEQISNQYGMKTWINKTWLDKLGLKMPATTEEFREVMRAFVTMDPNGNGKADELGMTGNVDGWCAQPYRFLINSFIYEGNPEVCKYVNVEYDGSLYFNFTRDEYQAALTYLSELSREGLFDTLAFSRSGEEMIRLAQEEDNVIGCFTSGNPELVFSENRQRMFEYEALPPLEGPEGVAYAYMNPSKVGRGAFITKYCRHPLAAFRLLDFMLSKEATIRSRYGVEGRDWSYAGENDRCLFESIGEKAMIKSNYEYGIRQNATWENRNPEFRYADIANGMAWNGNPYDSEKFKADALLAYYNKGPENYVTKFSNTEEEYEQITELENAVLTYAEEQIQAFICGKTDVSTGWQEFQSELESRGAGQLLELLQKGYERYEQTF